MTNIHIRGQFRIQQMAFMLVAVFFFFILVGLFFLGYQSKSIKGDAQQLQQEKAVSSLQVLIDMPELTCGPLCIDTDKAEVMSSEFNYGEIMPVASIEIYNVYPAFTQQIKCPAPDCNYYDIYESRQGNITKYSTFVSLCQRVKENDYIYNKCWIGKLLVGVKQ